MQPDQFCSGARAFRTVLILFTLFICNVSLKYMKVYETYFSKLFFVNQNFAVVQHCKTRLVYPFPLIGVIGGYNLAKLKQNFKNKIFKQIFLRKYLLLLVHLFFLLLLHKCCIISYLLLIYQNERYAMFTLYIYICIYIYKNTYLYIYIYIYIHTYYCSRYVMLNLVRCHPSE